MPPRECKTDAAGVTFSVLSNAELGELFAETARAHAARRTGSSRDFWRKLLDESDMVGLLAEFRSRARARELDYHDWLDAIASRGL